MKIAVLIGGIAYESQRRLLDGIAAYAEENGVGVFTFTCNGDMYMQSEYGLGEFQIFSLPDFMQYDGCILVKDTIQNEKILVEITKRIRMSGIPTVSIDTSMEGASYFYVDNRESMQKMVEHFVTVHKIKRICYLSGPIQNPESIERLRGVWDVVEKYELPFSEENIFYGNFWVDSGREFVKKLLGTGGKLPEAVICANDDMALGVYLELTEQGIEVGKQILLSGFDHTSDSANLTPSIATVEKPQEKMGYEACRKLAEEDGLVTRKFDVKYYFRGSCGCPKHRNRNLAEVQVRNVKEKVEVVNMAEINRNMVSDLNDCDNLDDFCECLKRYIIQIHFSFFYLCLCEDSMLEGTEMEYVKKPLTTYSEKLYIPVAYENGNFSQYGLFENRQLLPECYMKNVDQTMAIAAPLHFRQNCIGYCVMGGSRLPMNNTQFQNWIMNISNALENIRNQSELRHLVEKLNRVWMYDHLTQVYNRAGFLHFAGNMVEDCRISGDSIGILFVDINKLKNVNDTYGHEEGDFYIKSVADCLKQLKDEDQMLMRYGGDEFVVLGRAENSTGFAKLQEELNGRLAALQRRMKKPYEMSASIGFHAVPVTEKFKLDLLMDEADKEMYKMKKRRSEGR